MRYLLPESTVVIDGKVDLIWDTRLARQRLYAANPVASVALSVRADDRHGVRGVNSPKRGDNSLTLDLTDDQRLAGVAFNSVDRHSRLASRRLVGRSFGEQAAELVFTDLGVPKKLVTGEKSAVGAVADAIVAAPDQFTSGLDAVSKSSTTLGDLSAASAEARLKAITRAVDQRTKELELVGINATAADFVELKRLKQRLEIVTAQGGLAPPSELANLQAELEKRRPNGTWKPFVDKGRRTRRWRR